MRYSLWSHGRLVGHTDLDIHTITASLRQGFIEPTPEGEALLADATGVWRAMAEVRRDARARGEPGAHDRQLVDAAIERRESLDFELRDERGSVFDCEFMRVSDLRDLERGVVDEMSPTEEEEEADFQIYLSGLSGEAREAALARRAEIYAEIEEMVAEIRAERDEQTMFGSAWPPPRPDDPRWNTMHYALHVHLRRADQ